MNHRLITLIISITLFITGAALFWKYSIDDAFITFRYAEHLADGYSLAFSIGDRPVEGYSNFLWLLILALFYKIGLPTFLSAKVLGLVGFLCAGLLWFKYTYKCDDLLWLTAPLFFICPITSFWGISGLELGLHTFLISLVVLLQLKQSYWLMAILPLIVLSRPEGFIIAIVLVSAGAIVDSYQKQFSARYLLAGITTIGLTMLALVLFRLSVFGYSLPNTYYAKQNVSILPGLPELQTMLLIFLPFVAVFIVTLVQVLRRRVDNRLIAVVSLLFVAQALISATVVPVMNFHFRYVVSFLPLLFLAALYALSKMKPIVQKTFYVLILISFAYLYFGVEKTVATEEPIWQAQQELISWINLQPETTRITMIDMGRVPYYTKIRYHDIGGLADHEIAHQGFSAVRELQRAPDFFVLVGHFQDDRILLKFGRERLIAGSSKFLEYYELIKVCTPPGVEVTDSGYHYLIYQKK